MPFPVDIRYIIETEKELGLEFPDNFKNKMLRENGGELTTETDDWQIFPFFDRSDNKRISRTINHIILETKQAKEWNNFPQESVAIAANGFGDFLILFPKENNKKKLSEEIYIWFHETGDIEKISDTIDELID